jgi:hypothetical protein
MEGNGYLVGELGVVGEHLQERVDVLAVDSVSVKQSLYF